MSRIIPVVTGPTASGKSDLVYEAARLRGDIEIISADAFQVYKRLDIGTAKPNAALRAEIPHHLVDIIETDGSFNAGDFVEHAERAIADILSRGKLPVVTGGTGLYIRSLRDGIFHEPETDPLVREKLRQRLTDEGGQALHAELEAVDPEAAAKIHYNDHVRILRALEIWHSSGRTISSARLENRGRPAFACDILVVERERQSLYDDINLRVDKMLRRGWLDEVKGLLDAGYAPDLSAFRAIGYSDLAKVVSGETTLKAAAERIAQKTRNFAKRQYTWFRGMGGAFHMSAGDILRKLRES